MILPEESESEKKNRVHDESRNQRTQNGAPRKGGTFRLQHDPAAIEDRPELRPR
jgi:hypothetical protein